MRIACCAEGAAGRGVVIGLVLPMWFYYDDSSSIIGFSHGNKHEKGCSAQSKVTISDRMRALKRLEDVKKRFQI